jgi:Arc/MetJ-type ribon-helix-helix transcriptional regulator
MSAVKLSVSLSEDDVALLDAYAQSSGLRSRSAVVQHALRRLREVDLEADYTAAWREWDRSGERQAWEATSADGLL